LPIVTEACIPADHPSLAGHFPGHPIVPGVVLLDAVLEAAGRQLGPSARVSGLPSAKFLAPLEPGVPFCIELEPASAGTLGFIVEAAGRTIARGSLRYSSTGEAR
jgi:3-hydroxymyristoyl/3-hydroxydecanoyl-(acyl carrier protein) dehydratase